MAQAVQNETYRPILTAHIDRLAQALRDEFYATYFPILTEHIDKSKNASASADTVWEEIISRYNYKFSKLAELKSASKFEQERIDAAAALAKLVGNCPDEYTAKCFMQIQSFYQFDDMQNKYLEEFEREKAELHEKISCICRNPGPIVHFLYSGEKYIDIAKIPQEPLPKMFEDAKEMFEVPECGWLEYLNGLERMYVTPKCPPNVHVRIKKECEYLDDTLKDFFHSLEYINRDFAFSSALNKNLDNSFWAINNLGRRAILHYHTRLAFLKILQRIQTH